MTWDMDVMVPGQETEQEEVTIINTWLSDESFSSHGR